MRTTVKIRKSKATVSAFVLGTLISTTCTAANVLPYGFGVPTATQFQMTAGGKTVTLSTGDEITFQDPGAFTEVTITMTYDFDSNQAGIYCPSCLRQVLFGVDMAGVAHSCDHFSTYTTRTAETLSVTYTSDGSPRNLIALEVLYNDCAGAAGFNLQNSKDAYFGRIGDINTIYYSVQLSSHYNWAGATSGLSSFNTEWVEAGVYNGKPYYTLFMDPTTYYFQSGDPFPGWSYISSELGSTSRYRYCTSEDVLACTSGTWYDYDGSTTSFVSDPDATVSVGNYRPYVYLGCFTDTATRALEYFPEPQTSWATVETCYAKCDESDYKYFALQAGGFCFCSNSYDSATQYGVSTGCPTAGARLGSNWANDLFKIAQERYTLVTDAKTWSDAEAYCQSTYNSHLATITSDVSAQALKELCSDCAFWIGLNDIAVEDTWEYADGTAVPEGSSYKYWNDGEPNNADDGENCAEINTARAGLLLLNDGECHYSHQFACNINPTPTTPPGYSVTKDVGCIGQNDQSLEGLSFDECVDVCNGLSGCLSFEYFPNHKQRLTSVCQPSTTCTLAQTVTADIELWGTSYFYAKSATTKSPTMNPTTATPPTVPGYLMTEDVYCSGQNDQSLNSVSLAECVDVCNGLNGCLSFEYFPNHKQHMSSLCQPSTTCTVDQTLTADTETWGKLYFYYKSTSNPTTSIPPTRHPTANPSAAASPTTCDYHDAGPITLEANKLVHSMSLEETLEISFDLRINTVCSGYCHILHIWDSGNGIDRLPLLYTWNSRFVAEFRQSSATGKTEDALPDIYSSMTDGAYHNFNLQYTATHRTIAFDSVTYVDVTDVDQPLQMPSWIDITLVGVGTNQFVTDATMTNLCITTRTEARYILVTDAKSWSDAEAYCQSTYGTHLATITGDESAQALKELCPLCTFWIGLNDIAVEDTWEYADGTAVPEGSSYKYWNDGEPNNVGEEDCAEADTARTIDLLLNDGACSTSLQFVCNINPTPAPTMNPTTATPPTVPGYSVAEDVYCVNQNDQQINSVSLDECVDVCNGLDGCLSFEYFPNHKQHMSSRCQPSTTCTVDQTLTADTELWGKLYFYYKSTTTKNPSATPTKTPSDAPTLNPSVSTMDPTASPTISLAPTMSPSAPTVNPSAPPTTTVNPSSAPTLQPTSNPSVSPTLNPSAPPTLNPSSAPTINPSQNPSASPTELPSYSPTIGPTTSSPTMNPSIGPTAHPTAYDNYECDEIPFILVIFFEISTSQAYYEDDLIDILITVMVDTIKSLIDTPWNSEWCVDLRKSNLIANGNNRRRLLQNTVDYKATFNFNSALKTDVFDDDDFSFGRFKKDLSDNMEERLSDTILTEDEGKFTMDSATGVEDIAENTTATKTETFFDFSDPLMIVLMVLIGVSVCVMVGGKIHAHVVAADDFRLGPVFLFTIYVWDFYTDLLFALSLYASYVSPERPDYMVLFIASVVFLVCPLAKNFYDLLQFEDVWREHKILSDLYKTWLLHYGQYVYILSFLCGSTYAAINLVNSNFLGMRAFSMGLSRVDVLKFNQKRLLNVVLLENLPQLIIQVIFAYLAKQLTDISLLAIASSAVSIVLAILKHINHQKSVDDEKVKEVMFTFELYHETNGDLTPYIHKTHAVSKAIESALSLTRRTVECLPINKCGHDDHGAGLEINCVIRTTKKNPTELNDDLIERCDMNGDGHLRLKKLIASQWDMTGELITVFDPNKFHEANASVMDMDRKNIQLTNMKTAGEGDTDTEIVFKKDDDNALKPAKSVKKDDDNASKPVQTEIVHKKEDENASKPVHSVNQSAVVDID